MFSNRQQGLLRLHFLAQLIALLALLGISALHPFALHPAGAASWDAEFAMAMLLIAAALVEFVSRPHGLRIPAHLGPANLSALSYRQCVFLLGAVFCLLLIEGGRIPGVNLLAFLPASVLWIFTSNRFGFHFLDRLLFSSPEKGFSNTLLIGSPDSIRRFWNSRGPALPPGTQVVGYVDVDASNPDQAPGIPRLGKLDDLRTICRQREARSLLLLDLFSSPQLVPELRALTSELGVRATWIEDLTDRFGIQSQTYHDENFAVVSQIREPLEDPLNRAFKRAFDLAFSSLGIALLLPPAIALVAALHAIYSPGPLFYRQQRSGRNQEAFRIFKFRSMHLNPQDQFVQAQRADPRIFPGGLLLRKFSIDELPQLLNVFLGQMSLVGPRPHPLALDEQLTMKNREYRLRNLAKPGITGLAQCRGWRGETRDPRQIRNRVRLDLFYVRHWSLWLDLRIIVETATQLLKPPRSAF